MLGLTRENLTGVRVVRAFDKEQSEIDRFESANDLLTRMQLHVGHISSLMSPLTYVIINLASWLCSMWAASRSMWAAWPPAM